MAEQTSPEPDRPDTVSIELAFVIAALIGAVYGVVVGYAVDNLPNDSTGGLSFGYWLTRPAKYVWWCVLGSAVELGRLYIRRVCSR